MYDKVILKNSMELNDNVHKVPLEDECDYGELLINYASNNEAIFSKNDSNKIAEFCPSYKYEEIFSIAKNNVFYQSEEPDGKDGDMWIKDDRDTY